MRPCRRLGRSRRRSQKGVPPSSKRKKPSSAVPTHFRPSGPMAILVMSRPADMPKSNWLLSAACWGGHPSMTTSPLRTLAIHIKPLASRSMSLMATNVSPPMPSRAELLALRCCHWPLASRTSMPKPQLPIHSRPSASVSHGRDFLGRQVGPFWCGWSSPRRRTRTGQKRADCPWAQRRPTGDRWESELCRRRNCRQARAVAVVGRCRGRAGRSRWPPTGGRRYRTGRRRC